MAGAEFQNEAFAFRGGIDQVTPALSLAPGKLIDALNYEPDLTGGYRRMYGYERFDGHASPSSQEYWLQAITLTGAIAVGNTVTGATSGATAVVLQVNGTTEIVVTRLTGTFVVENLQVGGITQAALASTRRNAATTAALHASYTSLAANNYRASIAAVPGSGPVRGAVMYNNVVYAFRDNVGATACLMYKSTASGWTQVTFGRTLNFSGAVGQVNDGDTVIGFVSGAVGVVGRALLRTGTWTSAGVGSLQLDSVVGAFTSGEALKVGGVTKVTSSSADSAITLAAGGRYEFSIYNFSGSSNSIRLYGVSGVNKGFEFDGTRYVPIPTGLHTDTPTYLATHRNALFFAYGSAVEASGPGTPYSWTALTGAAVIGLGANCSGMIPQPGNETSGALAIFAFSNAGTAGISYVLYGNSSLDFNLVTQSSESGAQPYTAQNIGYAYFFDTKGVCQLNTTRNYGNFEMSTVSRAIQPMIDSKRGLATASCIVRSTNQYRVFFSDGTGIIMYVKPADDDLYAAATTAQVSAFMRFDYGSSLYVNCVTSCVDGTGDERIFAGGSDGFVYELERGTSMDGAVITSHLLTAFNSGRQPMNRKTYKRTVLQATCSGTASVTVGYNISYSGPEAAEGARTAQSLVGGGSWWDTMIWDTFNWDAPYVTDYVIDTPGNGTNINFAIYGSNAVDLPYTINSAIVSRKVGRQER